MQFASKNFSYTNDSAIDHKDATKLESESMVLTNTTESYDFNTTEIPFLENHFKEYKEQQKFYINVYTILIVGSVLLNTARSILFFKISMRASKGLHDTMFNNILQATMRFFDTNPSGKFHYISNKFAQRFQYNSCKIEVVLTLFLPNSSKPSLFFAG